MIIFFNTPNAGCWWLVNRTANCPKGIPMEPTERLETGKLDFTGSCRPKTRLSRWRACCCLTEHMACRRKILRLEYGALRSDDHQSFGHEGSAGFVLQPVEVGAPAESRYIHPFGLVAPDIVLLAEDFGAEHIVNAQGIGSRREVRECETDIDDGRVGVGGHSGPEPALFLNFIDEEIGFIFHACRSGIIRVHRDDRYRLLGFITQEKILIEQVIAEELVETIEELQDDIGDVLPSEEAEFGIDAGRLDLGSFDAQHVIDPAGNGHGAPSVRHIRPLDGDADPERVRGDGQ